MKLQLLHAVLSPKTTTQSLIQHITRSVLIQVEMNRIWGKLLKRAVEQTKLIESTLSERQ